MGVDDGEARAQHLRLGHVQHAPRLEVLEEGPVPGGPGAPLPPLLAGATVLKAPIQGRRDSSCVLLAAPF